MSYNDATKIPGVLEDKTVHVVYKAPSGYSGEVGDREKEYT